VLDVDVRELELSTVVGFSHVFSVESQRTLDKMDCYSYNKKEQLIFLLCSGAEIALLVH